MVRNCSFRGSSRKADDLRTAACASQNTIAGTVQRDPKDPLHGRFENPVLSSGTTTQNAISTRRSRLPQLSATCSVDSDGNFMVSSSAPLQSRLGELFSAPFRDKFLQIVAETDATVHIERQVDAVEIVLRINNGPLASCVTKSESDHDALAKTCSSKNKRPRSCDNFRTKRRKSCTHELNHSLSSSKAVRVKKEDRCKGSGKDEKVDLEELVDTEYFSTNIRADDDFAIDMYIDDRLKRINQASCRSVAKLWIKAIEPRKQTKYPYNAGDRKEEASSQYGEENMGELTKPPWWPPTEGWQTGKGCRHREPDHLKKPERLVLLKHLLEHQPVALLQESTNNLPSSFEPQPKKFLKEVYRIRRHQLRFKEQEIDGSTTIAVALPPISDGQGVSNGTKIEPDKSPIQENLPLRLQSKTLSPIHSLDASQQEVARHDSSSLDIPNEACNELGLPSGEDMHVPAPKPEQNAVYPMRHRFSDMGSFDVPIGNGTRVLEQTKFDHHQDGFKFALMPQNRAYPGDQRCLGKTTSSSFQGEQAYDEGYSGTAGLPLACLGKSEWAGLTEHPAEANCARADTLLTQGLAGWPELTFPNEQYGFGNTSMCTPSLASIEQEFPPSQGKFRQSLNFQRASSYSEAPHCSRATPGMDPSNL